MEVDSGKVLNGPYTISEEQMRVRLSQVVGFHLDADVDI
jgi:hypothetical protein